MKKHITCAFSGHRKIKSANIEGIKISLEREILYLYNIGYRNFMTGGALGFDTLSAKVILDMKKSRSDIRLILALPCFEQTNGWSIEDKFIHEMIKCDSDDYIYVSGHYKNTCMRKRNMYMVDHSSVLVCYQVYKRGGTVSTVKYAKEREIPIINIAD